MKLRFCRVRAGCVLWSLLPVLGGSACSDGYSLGDLTTPQPLAGDVPTGDFTPGATLGAPDVTVEYGGSNAYAAAVGLGDLDGDGLDDTAAFELEEAAGLSAESVPDRPPISGSLRK